MVGQIFRTFSVLLLIMSSQAWARSAYSGYTDLAAKNLFGASASYSFDCAGCHGTSGSHDIVAAGTGFGKDVRSEALARGYSPFSLTAAQIQTILGAISGRDSDGDTATNGQELLAGTNPGDPASLPVVCTRGNPRLTLSPTSQSGMAGASLSYSLSISNADSVGCNASTFVLEASVPAALSANLSMASVVLNPAQTTIVTVSVASSASALAGNQIFSISATNSAVASSQSTVSGTYVVQVPTPVCTRSNPIVSISPATQSEYAGQMLSYTVSVRNADSVECSASTFNLTGTVPAGWASQLSVANLTLSPGQTGSASIQVTSPAGAMPQSYSFSVRASDAAIATHSGQASANYVVMAMADLQAPSVPQNVSAQLVKRKYQISWTASQDNVAVTKYSVYVDGVLKAETTSTAVSVRLRRGVHSVTVTAWDAAGNQSDPSVAIQVGQ